MKAFWKPAELLNAKKDAKEHLLVEARGSDRYMKVSKVRDLRWQCVRYLVEVLVEPVHEEQQQLLGVLLVIASKLVIDLAYGDLKVPRADALVQTAPQRLHDHSKLLRHLALMAKDVVLGDIGGGVGAFQFRFLPVLVLGGLWLSGPRGFLFNCWRRGGGGLGNSDLRRVQVDTVGPFSCSSFFLFSLCSLSNLSFSSFSRLSPSARRSWFRFSCSCFAFSIPATASECIWLCSSLDSELLGVMDGLTERSGIFGPFCMDPFWPGFGSSVTQTEGFLVRSNWDREQKE
ncbi:hypothetical protein F7725_026526 [Dissostichus mawsoni]|uniref:Uncharacterized protein n=1 Tax=Dissostichus mawsoni TaxID=36200 RepID=A0A7J5X7C3_DISMA|nr:hypothetical protein F7725_026526 [Dissostichus mawsoni]